MKEYDKFGREVTRVRVNWDNYLVPEYKVGDLVQSRDSKRYGLISDVLGCGELEVDFGRDHGNSFVQDYDVILVSPIDNQ